MSQVNASILHVEYQKNLLGNAGSYGDRDD